VLHLLRELISPPLGSVLDKASPLAPVSLYANNRTNKILLCYMFSWLWSCCELHLPHSVNQPLQLDLQVTPSRYIVWWPMPSTYDCHLVMLQELEWIHGDELWKLNLPIIASTIHYVHLVVIYHTDVDTRMITWCSTCPVCQ